MGFNAGEVYAVLGAKVNPAGFAAYDAAIDKSTASAARFEERNATATASAAKFGSAARTAGTVGLAALAAGTIGAISAASRFQKQMSEVQAVTKANAREMRQMGDAAKELGAKSGLGATAVAKGIAELAKGGVSTAQILNGALGGAIALAQAGQMDLATAAETTANALNLFGLSGSKAGHVADALAMAANKTTADVSDFAMALTQGGSAAKTAGLSFDETVTALEALALAGVKGSDAGTSLKSALLQVLKPTKQSAETMKQLGIDFTDAHGRMKPLADIAGMLKERLSGLTREQKVNALQTMAGTDGFRALAALADQGSGGVKRLQGSLREQGTAADVAKTKTDNLSGSWDRFKAKVQGVAIDLGDKALPTLKDGLDDINGAIDDLSADGGLDRALHIDTGKLGQDASSVASTIGSIFDHLHVKEGIENELAGMSQAVGGAFHALGALVRGDLKGVVSGVGQILSGGLKAATAPIAATLETPFRHAADAILGIFSSILSGAATVVGQMAKIPGVGGAFKGLANGVQAAADKIDGLRDSIREIQPPPPLPINVEARQAVTALKHIQGTKLETKVVRVLGQDTDAKTKLNALRALGIPTKTAKVLAAVGNALSGIGSVRAMLAALHDKIVTVETRRLNTTINHTINSTSQAGGAQGTFKKKATGRGPGGAETALVGEGRHAREAIIDPATGRSMVVDGPTVMDLSPSAYVIPEDPMQRGRSMGLLRMLAEDLGLRGFAKSKKPAKRHRARYVPSHLEPLAFPVEDFDTKETAARGALNDAKGIVGKEPGLIRTKLAQIRDIERRNPKSKAQKANKADDLKRARQDLAKERKKLAAAKSDIPKLRAEWQQRKKEAVAAHRYAADLQREQDIADTAADEMALADRHDDQGAYDAAKGRRDKALGARRTLLAKAQALAKAAGNTNYAASLGAQVARLDVELADNTDATMDEVEDPDLTKAQKAMLARDDRDISLAALTAGLGDDTAAARRKVSDLEGILTALQGGGQPSSDSLIGSVADMVKGARDNLASLTGGGGTNDNQDLQAQIDQANERTRVANAEAAANAKALAVFGSTGDIGTGGFRAALAAPPTVNVYTLHPGDPRTKLAIADAAASGFGLQPRRPSKTERLGV